MKHFFSLLFFSIWIGLTAQEKPRLIIISDTVEIVKPLSQREYLPRPKQKKEMNKKRKSGQNIIVPGKGFPKNTDPLLQYKKSPVSYKNKAPLLTFEASTFGGTPTDPTGAAGPNHYVVAYNSAFKIFDKNGNVLVPDTSLSAIFTGTNDDGDPIVLYDQFADRFIITEFDLASDPKKLMLAISQGPDPVNDGWYVYRFNVNAMPDYPKYSIWSDAYYVTANKSDPAIQEVVFAMERDKMINGDPTARMLGFNLPGIAINGFYSPSGFHVNGNMLPPRGNAPIIYLQDDSWAGVNDDHLKIWNVQVDWNTPENSFIELKQELITSDFNSVFDNGSFENLLQPNGVKIDALQATIMFMTNYRRFSTFNSVVLNFVVNTDNQAKAGIRWYELRQNNDGEDWYIYQEGTYIDPSGENTFAGSIQMDGRGDIGLGYTIVGPDQVPELHYTGRYFSDPVGEMTIQAQTVVPGVESSYSSRYGDYAQLTIDPSDDVRFWFISEYFNNNRRVDQVAVFKFASEYAKDIGVVSILAPENSYLGNNEEVQIEIRNYGTETQSNFEVFYQIDNGTPVTETFTGSILPGEKLSYTFLTKADLSITEKTYIIKAGTALQGDADTNNDIFTKEVRNLIPTDVGIAYMISPVSSSQLGNAESIEVVVKNYGGEPQSNFPISYTINNGTPVEEIFQATLAPDSQQNFTFSTPADMSTPGLYELKVKTNLQGDMKPENDELSRNIMKSICEPASDCTNGDEIYRLKFADIDHISDCTGTGYSDFTNIKGTISDVFIYPLTLTTKYGNEYVNAWIDFNSNFVFEAEEKIIDNQLMAPGKEDGVFTESFDTNLPYPLPIGEHLMRVRISWNQPVPDACIDVSYGETEDYLIEVKQENTSHPTQILLQDFGNNHFQIQLLYADIEKEYDISLYDISGKRLLYYPLRAQNGHFVYPLDLSYIAKGVYLLNIKSEGENLIKKILVK